MQSILFWAYWFILILPNLILTYTEPLGWIGKLILVFLPASVYGICLTLHRKPGVSLWAMFLFLFLGAFQIVLSYLFGRGVIAVDMWLNLTTTNSTEAGELLAQLLPSIVAVIVIYLPALIFAFFSIRSTQELSSAFRKRMSAVSYCLLGFSILLTVVAYTRTNWNLLNDLFPVNAIYNCYLSTQRGKASREYKERVKNFRFEARSTHTDTIPEVIVCVIGETSRASNWQLYGYERETTPLLAAQENLTLFQNVLTQSNTTHKSVPLLLSPASAEDFELLYRTKGILAAFREAGYHTYFFSNQRPNSSFIDFLGEQAEESLFIKENRTDEPLDTELLTPFKEALQKEKGRKFIVLHTYGSHFDYNDRYPAETCFFTPDRIPSAKRKYRKELINAYDNTLRYTDKFLNLLISSIQEKEKTAALLYLSDHGEDIFDFGRGQFLHASPMPSYNQLHVPFFIWTSERYRQLYPTEVENLQNNRRLPIGSDCVFHTLLGLGGIETSWRNDSLSLTSNRFYAKERHYLNDHNEAVSLEDCLYPEDYQRIQELSNN